MTTRDEPRVQSRLLRVFVLQLALISVATIASVMAASIVVERILVNRALSGEANYFWQHRQLKNDFPIPNTLNLQGFLSGDPHRNVPTPLADLGIGQQRVQYEGDEVIAYVSEQNGQRLTLVFQDETVSSLGFFFGVVPLTLVLLVMYALAYFAYLLTKRAVSPIAHLADTIEKFDFNNTDATELSLNLGTFARPHNSETLVLVDALRHFIERTNDSLERERNFARYASHELRTPLAVLQGSVSSLELVQLDGAPNRAVKRMKRACKNMGDLIGTLLLLSRDKSDIDRTDNNNVNHLVDDLVSELEDTVPDKSVEVVVRHSAPLYVAASEAALRIVIGNILRNACNYTRDGMVTIAVTGNSVTVTDTGRGLSSTEQRRIFEPFYRIEGNGPGGHGLGLALVKNTCDNFRWTLGVQSEVGSGSVFSIGFGDSITASSHGA